MPLWFPVALAPMVVSEIVRLAQTDPLAWIACDYGGRIAALAVLAAVPAARRLAFAREKIRIAWWEAALWITLTVAFDRMIGRAAGGYLDALVPGTSIGHYPSPHGALFVIDISFGLALVAYSEEVIFRRCARRVLTAIVGDGWAMVIITAALFASYHWWTGAGNIVAAMSFGVLAMLFYRRAGALSPLILSHYLCDVILAAWPV
ncbi:MAG TPA: CPBP family intramembrane glutamic endopeptidase [Xanthobacteraceae bacterium]|nr:CPBP family intramembrane glutamic endopeptidase [Xanthobacteraceae bacterium]